MSAINQATEEVAFEPFALASKYSPGYEQVLEKEPERDPDGGPDIPENEGDGRWVPFKVSMVLGSVPCLMPNCYMPIVKGSCLCRFHEQQAESVFGNLDLTNVYALFEQRAA